MSEKETSFSLEFGCFVSEDRTIGHIDHFSPGLIDPMLTPCSQCAMTVLCYVVDSGTFVL